ncbi:MAG: NAD-dependent epimerase/dehydratase family protein [Gemmatimonadetes bacterium]|nr:NAD-dependent epimerase/dehydratase family protein [Gemmatimonadota bacterium]
MTGASGFIGGRIVEVLHASAIAPVRAGVRRWTAAARVGRLPVDLVRCDITNPADVASTLAGVSHIVHCAVGDRGVTVDGTRTLLAGALKAGVQRVVHISTADVYGMPEGAVDESHPLTYTGRPYGDSKIDAENVCQEFARRGLPITILRPTLVHGPFSVTWTVEFAQRLQARPWLIAEDDAQGMCNLLYVDDLVGAVLRALEAPTLPGEAFNVNGPERPTWNQYFHALNDAMGLPPLVAQPAARARLTALAVQPVRRSAKIMLKHFQPQIMAAYQRYDWAKVVMKRAEGIIRKTPSPSEFPMYRRRASYSTQKAEQVLGWRPQVAMSNGVRLAADWLRHQGLVTGAS